MPIDGRADLLAPLRCAACGVWLLLLETAGGEVWAVHRSDNSRLPECPHRGKSFRLPVIECEEREGGKDGE